MKKLGSLLVAMLVSACGVAPQALRPSLAWEAVGSAQVAEPGSSVALLAAQGVIKGSGDNAQAAMEKALDAARKAAKGKLGPAEEAAIRKAIQEALDAKGACQGVVNINLHIHFHGKVDAGVSDGGSPSPSASPSVAPSASPSVAPSASPSAGPTTSPSPSEAPSAAPSEHPDGPYLTGVALGPRGELLRFELDPGQEALPTGVGRTGGRLVVEHLGERRVVDDLVGYVGGGAWAGDRLLVASFANTGQALMKRYVAPTYLNEIFEMERAYGEPGAPWGAVGLVNQQPFLAVGASRDEGGAPWRWSDPYYRSQHGPISQDANARPFDAAYDPLRRSLVWSSVGGLRQVGASGAIETLDPTPVFGLAYAPEHGMLSTDYGLLNSSDLTLTAPDGSRRVVWQAASGFPCRVAVGASGEVAVLVDPEAGSPGGRLPGNHGAQVVRLHWVGSGAQAHLE